MAGTSEDTALTTGARDRDLVPLSEVGRHIGKLLRVVTADGRSFKGQLVSVDGNELVFERHLRSGTIAVPWDKSEIQSLHKVRKRP